MSTTTQDATKRSPRDTPAMKQYFGFKKKYPDCVLFFRMGDFYELFDDDAVLASRALGLTLTQRSQGLPMAGVPHHTMDTYALRMLKQGHRVAICDQIQDPKEAKGVVERAVTRVLTPGTIVDDALLEDESASLLASVVLDGAMCHLAIIECSTGVFTLNSCQLASLRDELARTGIRELLTPELATGGVHPEVEAAALATGVSLTPRPAWEFRLEESTQILCEQFGVATLEGFGLSDSDCTTQAAGALVRYLRETQHPQAGSNKTLGHLTPPRRVRADDRLILDATSLRALEIEHTIRGNSLEGSLLGIFHNHGGRRTPMGKRLLREWLKNPSTNLDTITARQRCVTTLLDDRRFAQDIATHTDRVQDVARIAGRLGLGRATPRDLVALGQSLAQLPGLLDVLSASPAFADIATSLQSVGKVLSPIAEEIQHVCIENPPTHLREGGLFRDNIDALLDEVRTLQHDASSWLATYQAELIKTHDLPNLKVGYNRVFGYYIELPAAQATRAPDIFTRKQTLKNAERYITPELKTFEDKVTSAQSRAIDREHELFAQLCARLSVAGKEMSLYADAIAQLDVLACFAHIAARKNWVIPTLVTEPVLDIRDGRHPVLDDLLGDDFVPNDTALGTPDTSTLCLITGPNMSGKSTYIRQAAILTLLAHTGSCIPCASATIGLCDRIFTRVGADDALHEGQSTFMVEMTQTASILHHCTPRSLIVLDEIGRGTSTLDGLSLAWAIAERLASNTDAPGPRTLFATHYHELTTLEEEHPGRVRNLHVAVREWGDEVVFLHRIQPGRANRSYGIHVAKLAGLPQDTVARAQVLLDSLAVSHASTPIAHTPQNNDKIDQMGLFAPAPHTLVEQLASLDLENLSPMQAFEILRTMRVTAQDSAHK